MIELLLNGKPVQFKIDTGADVTAISEKLFQKLDRVTLRETSKSLHGYFFQGKFGSSVFIKGSECWWHSLQH